MARTLSTAKIEAVYDRLGARHDWLAACEDPARADLIAHSAFAAAHAVFEFGCGTGRFARTLLAEHLPADASYLGVDVSTTMVQLSRARLSPWSGRAEVRRTSGSPHLAVPAGGFDRFVATYVLDLLSDEDMRATLREAYRVLSPDGLLCLANLTEGATPWARVVTGLWKATYAVSPAWVGGCRPTRLREILDPGHWTVRHHRVWTKFGISFEAVVTARREG